MRFNVTAVEILQLCQGEETLAIFHAAVFKLEAMGHEIDRGRLIAFDHGLLLPLIEELSYGVVGVRFLTQIQPYEVVG